MLGETDTGISADSRRRHLLHVVDLIVLPLLVARDLPLGLIAEVSDSSNLRVFPHGVLHRLGECQPIFPHPLVQAPVNCSPNIKLSVHLKDRCWFWFC